MAVGTNVHFFLYADASPQFRGAELWAVSVEVYEVDTGYIWRFLLPVLALNKGMLDGCGKLIALLFQLWLVSGPGFETVRWLCSRIYGVTTDMGVERRLVDWKDVLPILFSNLHPVFDNMDLGDTTYIFPNCLEMPGFLGT